MLSAVITSERSQPAVPLAGQLAHQSCVRPGPLVLGTAFLKSPTAAADRDRHSCYPDAPHARPSARSFLVLPGSPCRHEGRTISSPTESSVFGIWPLRILGLRPAFPADCPHRSDCHCPRSPPYEGGVTAGASTVGYSEFPAYSRIYRQRVIHCLTTF